MPLLFESRRVGDITVVRCRGRIVEGVESVQLRKYLNDLIAMNPYLVLHLAEVDFIDSSGIGLLVRFLTRMENSQGSLKLCAISPGIANILRVTRLNTIFEVYESEAAAIAGFYQRRTLSDRRFPEAEILCVEQSADVLAYVRELLRQAGFGVVTTSMLSDAFTLQTAMRPKLVVIGAGLLARAKTNTAAAFSRLAETASIIELPANFSTDDAGEAGRQLVANVQAILSASGGPAKA